MRKKSTLPGEWTAPSGQPICARIVRLAHGQSYGYLRAADDRDVFFHRADTRDEFKGYEIGDVVTFELLEDRLSGPRAIRVRRKGAKNHDR